MKDLKSLTLEELKEELKEGGFPAYRAGQLYRWLHVQLAEDPEEMTNLPAKLKQFLSENYTMTRLQVADRQISRLDGTQKFLFQLPDGETIESVFMKYKFGNSVCVLAGWLPDGVPVLRLYAGWTSKKSAARGNPGGNLYHTPSDR